MKVLQFCQLYPPAIYGGGEFLFYQYAKQLVRMGHEVDVITQRLIGTPQEEVLEGVRVHRVGRPVSYKGHLSMNFLDNASFLLKSYQSGLKFRPDVIHANAYAPAISGHLVAKGLGVPDVISLFDVYSGEGFWKQWGSQKGVGGSLSVIGPLVEKLVLKLKPSLIHTISNQSKRDLLKAGVKAPVRIVPCGIDLKDYKTKRTKTKEQFCFVGRHVFYKNVDSIIKAMPAVLGKCPKAKFIIIGDGPMQSQWRDLARKLGVNGSVVFTGRVSHEHKLRIINESKFMVHPSVVEGFGIIILESWALNKPILVADLPPMNELVSSDNGGLVKPFSVSEWANHIIKHLKAKQGRGLKKYAKEYSIDKVSKKLVRLFKTVIV